MARGLRTSSKPGGLTFLRQFGKTWKQAGTNPCRTGGLIYRRGMAKSERFKFPRSVQTAPDRSTNLGWAEIRHPFHPLRGQRFEVLKKRRIAGVDTLILRERKCGSFSIAREWTDWAGPSVYEALSVPPRRLEAESLFELVILLEHLMRGDEKC